ncbi:asparagine synthase-related protein [Sphingomonas sp. J344]|uniref:asparagine synthase-related protein n=1 Tax=Sphingomonas sp. J344 TaxID=2898434 RepID=UPI0021518E3B|nr:asparagine synthase-related protein [Sphingomonas sp. J344]MCR5869488.1 asparagine synthase-related protein [Sphingomonas sp. J344]
MSAPRYLLLAGPSDLLDALLPHARAIAQDAQLSPVFDHPEARMFCPIDAVIRHDPHGIVIGSVFARDARALSDTSHATLLTHHWGNYLALEMGRRRAALLRAPFGELGCYHWSDGRLIVAASDMPLLSRWAGQPPAVDWQGVARHLLWSELRTGATCLSGISELQGGERLTFGPGPLRVETCWSPWDHAVACAPPDFEHAADQLRRIAIDCVGRLGSELAPILVQLSGGLDSSIVAAALARAGVRFDCVTFVTEDPTGDERIHARAVAAHLGCSCAKSIARSQASISPGPMRRICHARPAAPSRRNPNASRSRLQA